MSADLSLDAEDDGTILGIRRWGDACFHTVEEEVPEGFIVEGILIRREDVLEVRKVRAGEPCPTLVRAATVRDGGTKSDPTQP